MNLLSDEEICKVFDDVQSAIATAPWFIRYAQALQAAILAKLASAELPEPVVIDRHESGIVIRGYTAAQLQQAHAQGFAAGAAAQLAEKPSAWKYDQNGDWWVTDNRQEVDGDATGDIINLYTRRQA